jgi:hypothetical protein
MERVELNQRSQAPRAQGWDRRKGAGSDLIVPNPKLKLLDQVREVMRLKHYSIRTERSYCDWIRRYIRFHRMRSREDLGGGEAKIEEFLSDLAVNGHVAASTQNQAFNALLFVYREILHQTLENIQAVRADRPVRVPTVLTPEEVKRVIGAMSGTPQLVAKLLLYARASAGGRGDEKPAGLLVSGGAIRSAPVAGRSNAGSSRTRAYFRKDEG